MKIKVLCMIILILSLAACQSKKSEQENIDRLLERQAQIQERQEAAVEDLEALKDSLAREQVSLLEQRSSKDREIKRLETDQSLLVEELNKEETEEVTGRKQELESRIMLYSDSMAALKQEIEELNESLDSISKNIAVYEVQENRAVERLESGVAEIDERMKKRESRKQQELKRVSLLAKRIAVADKKIDAYQMERQMYVDERDELLRTNAPEEKLAPFQEKISEMDSIIAVEEKSRSQVIADKRAAEQFIAETDRVMEELNQQIHNEYNQQAIIENFIASEKTRLASELEDMRQTRSRLMEEQTAITTELENIDQQMASLDRDMNLISNREMSEILNRQATMEQAEAELAREEATLLEEFIAAIDSPSSETTDSLGVEMKSLLKLGDELDSLNALIQSEKAELAATREHLSEQRARAAEQRARYGKAAGLTVLFIFLGGLALVTFFYFLGRRARTRKK